MSTSSYPLASFCSFEGQYQRFLTTPERIHADLGKLMTGYGVSVDLRHQVFEALNQVRFDEGFRFEHDLQNTRLVVYVCIRNPYADKGLEPLSGQEMEIPTAWQLV